MIMSVRDEIADACERLGFSPGDFSEVADDRAQELTASFLARFTEGTIMIGLEATH
jgi:hypothetical protein